MAVSSHPDFANPPVVETVLGVEFHPLEKWKVPHFGLFWKSLEPDFQEIEDQLPLASQIEEFEKTTQTPLPRFELLRQPPVRCWFIDQRRNVLLQLQNGRFIENWRKQTGAELYPHFEVTRDGFERDWLRFLDFLSEHKLGVPKVLQCEVSYLNHLELGNGWQSLSDVGNVFPPLEGIKLPGLPTTEAFELELRYLLPEKRGRLYVRIHPAVRESDGRDIFLFALTARGEPSSHALSDILGWFDFGREWIHRAFREFTSDLMRSIWAQKGNR